MDVRFDQDTVWLTRQQMAELFGRDRSVVTRHIRNAYRERELDPKATSAKFARVQSEGGRSVSREVDHYIRDRVTVPVYGLVYLLEIERAAPDPGTHQRGRKPGALFIGP